jgi:hypothetical protein
VAARTWGVCEAGALLEGGEHADPAGAFHQAQRHKDEIPEAVVQILVWNEDGPGEVEPLAFLALDVGQMEALEAAATVGTEGAPDEIRDACWEALEKVREARSRLRLDLVARTRLSGPRAAP